MLVRSASNAYFPQKINVISLPDRDEAVSKAVDQVWEHHLQYIEDLEELKKDRKRKPPVAAALEGLTDEEVYEEIKRRRGDGFTSGSEKSVKQAELETLIASREEIGIRQAGWQFLCTHFAQTASGRIPKWPWMDESSSGSSSSTGCVRSSPRWVSLDSSRRRLTSKGELEMGVVQAPLAREISWLPAIENRGEGDLHPDPE